MSDGAEYMAEKLKELGLEGTCLLKRLLQFKTTMNDPKLRPSVFDKQFEKVMAKMVSKFPEPVATEKMGGFDTLTSNAKQVLGELSAPYFALADSYAWVKKAKEALDEIAGALQVLTLKETPGTVTSFLNLVQGLGQVCLFVGQLPSYEKRVVLMVYSRVHYHQTKQEEPLFRDAAQWLAKMDDPVLYIAEALAPCAKPLAACLKDLQLALADVTNISKLRTDSVLNVTGKPGEMPMLTDDLLRFELLNAERVRAWMLYAALGAHLELRADDNLFGATLGCLLEENLVAHLTGSDVWKVHETFEHVWESAKTKDKKIAKNTSKQRKRMREIAAHAPSKGWAAHEQRRVFLAQELHGLVSIARDTPALIPLKINVMLAALAMAREEIFWYFRHTVNARAFCPKNETWDDPRITELIFYQHTLEETIYDQNESIARFFAQMLAGADADAAASAAAQLGSVGGQAGALANEMASLLAGFNGDADAVLDGVEAVDRVHNLYDALDYEMACRAECGQYAQALVTLHAIARHAEFVNALDNVLDLNSSLLYLWYYDDAVRAAYNAHVKDDRGQNGAAYCGTYLELLADFPRTANCYWAEEREYIGLKCVEEAESYCQMLAQRVREHVNAIVNAQQQFGNHLSDRHALYIYQTTRPNFKPPKDFKPPAIPGAESSYESRGKLRTLRCEARDMAQIVYALSQVGQVTVYDTRFTPLEYVREVIRNVLRNWFRLMLRPSAEGVMRRPSDVRRRYDSVLYALSSVEHFATLGLEAAWREVVLGEFYVADFCKFGTSEATPLLEVDANESTLYGVRQWYDNFFTKIVPNSAGNIVYSPIRHAFVTRTGVSSQLALPMAESMCSYQEIRALVSMMGPYGVKVMDASLLRRVANHTMTLKEQLAANAAALEDIAQSYSVEARFIDAARKLRDMDKFVTNAVQIGVLLTFRALLKEALLDVVHDATPYIASSIETPFNAYPRNINPQQGLLALDLLAADYGVDVGLADQSLKAVLKTATVESDQKTWRLLPVMFGVMFLSAPWREAHYIPSLDAYQGNLHLLCRVINSYVVAIASLIVYPPDDKQVVPFLTQFVEIACMTLLRQTRIPVKGEKKPDWAAITIFIDQFVDSCPLIPRNVLEQSIPYTLLRNLIKDIYATRPTDGW